MHRCEERWQPARLSSVRQKEYYIVILDQLRKRLAIGFDALGYFGAD